MRSQYVLMVLIMTTPTILGLKDVSTKMSLDYFEENFVKFICALTCRVDRWLLNFTKTASNRMIASSHVSIKNFDESKLFSCLKQPMNIIGILLDTNCVGYKEVMLYAASNMLLDGNHKWLLVQEESVTNVSSTETSAILDKENVNDITKFLEEIDTSVDSEITVAKETNAEQFNIEEVYNFGKIKGGKFVVSNMGTWSSEGLNISKTHKYYRRWDFQNLTLRMVVVMSVYPEKFDEQMLVGRVPGPGVNEITHIGSSILYEISTIHNFRYNYTVVDQWVAPFRANATRVATNSLYFKEQDITPVIRFYKDHIQYYDIIHPHLTSIETRYYYRILSYGPGKFENQFLVPLSTKAWWCVVAMSIACGAVLTAAAILEQHPSWGQYALFSVLATICQQFFEDVDSVRVSRPSTAGKLTILVTGIFCVLMYNYYTSGVVSWLLNGPPPSINSLWELLESPLKVAFEDIGYTKTWIKMTNYHYNKRNAKLELEMRRRKVWNKKHGEPLMVPLSEGIELIKSGEYAYHMEVNTANMLIALNFDQQELCELGSLHSMEPTSLYAAVQKNSPYKEFFIWSLARLAERGIGRCIHKRFLAAPMVCEGSSPRALALGGAAPAFILLGIGYIASLIIMIMERLVYERKIPLIRQKY